MKLKGYISLLALSLSAFVSCTNLDENIYSTVARENYYNSRKDVIRMVFRPFEHAYFTGWNWGVNEQTADQIVVVTHDTWFDDGGKYRRTAAHEYNVETVESSSWTLPYQGIGQCNFVIEELQRLDRTQFGFSQEEWDSFSTQNRALRAKYYLNLFDLFRNLLMVTHYHDQSLNPKKQVSPRTTFEFIESELKDCIAGLPVKQGTGGNMEMQGQLTKAAAATMLVRLYLNAEVYIGESRFDECEKWAREIISGKYGSYSVADRWDSAFDWNNETSPEVIFAYPGSKAYSFHQYSSWNLWWAAPLGSDYYFNDLKCKAREQSGSHMPKLSVAPSYDLDGNPYEFDLGSPVQKFRKYSGDERKGQILDERMKKYRNLGNSTREGMFLYGYLEYTENGVTKRVKGSGGADMCLHDAVGKFVKNGVVLGPDEWPGGVSNHQAGDHNSCYYFVKYPFYSDNDEGQLEADYTEFRLPEVIYSLAECLVRRGETEEAGKLLNGVRRRNYKAATEEQLKNILYRPEGNVELNLDEMLDEWGREFFGEGRRRIDLIRFGKFTTATWWDKNPDSDDHTIIFPLARQVLSANPNLEQNPGYNK